MIVIAKHLIEAVEAISLIPPRAGIVSSEFIRIRYAGGKMKLAMAAEAYGEVSVPGKGTLGSGKDWQFWVDRSLFEPFVLAAREKPTAEFKFLGAERLVVKCGRRRARFNKADAIAGYAVPPSDAGTVIKLTDTQKQLLQLAGAYATHDPTLADYNCVYLKEGTGILAASHSSAFHAIDKTVKATVPLPLLLVGLMTSSKPYDISLVKKSVLLQFPFGAICQLMNQKAKAGFPAKSLLKQLDEAASFPSRFTIKATSLLNALKRQEAIIAASVKRDLVAKMWGPAGNKWIHITCVAPQGQFTERVLLRSPLAKDINCEMLMAQLLPLAEHANALVDIEVKFRKDSSFYISGHGIRMLIARKGVSA